VLGVALGAAFKRLTLLGLKAPPFSALGLFLILLTAWSFQVEQVMATWLISLFQASVVVVGIPLASRSVLMKS
jgi:membrane-bound ClpP family serine protease